MADLLALLCDMFYFVFVTFPCGVLGQMLCLIVSIPDLCLLSSFKNISIKLKWLHKDRTDLTKVASVRKYNKEDLSSRIIFMFNFI